MNYTSLIHAFEIEHFKSISEKATIPLKPITLIFGPNSSGKSSIIQSLLLLKQTLTESSSKDTILLSKGSLVDLGSYKDFVFKNDITRKISFTISVVLPDDISLDCLLPHTVQDNDLDDIVFSMKRISELFKYIKKMKLEITFCYNSLDSIISIDSFRLFLAEETQPAVKYVKDTENGSFTVKELNKNHPSIIGIFNLLSDQNFKIIDLKKGLNEFSTDLYYQLLNNLENMEYDEKCFCEYLINSNIADLYKKYIFEKQPDSWKIVLEEREGDIEVKKEFDFIEILNRIEANNEYFLFNIKKYNYQFLHGYFPEKLSKINLHVIPLSASNCIEHFLRDFIYLGPFRAMPERYYQRTGDIPSFVGIRGESFPFLLYNNSQSLDQLNDALSRFNIDYQVKVSKIAMSDTDLDDLFALRFINKKTGVESSIRDVGFGFSQVLPIIMQSVISNQSFIIIEQPELHIHPALQTELGDLFINSSLGEQQNKFLIETHSEHLILRILRRIRETTAGEIPEHVQPIKPEDICVLYVEPSEKGSIVKEMKVDENGEFLEWWPGGFFTERAEELF